MSKVFYSAAQGMEGNEMKRTPSKYPIVDGVQTMPDGKEICADTVAGRKKYKERTRAMVIRQGFRDPISGKPLQFWEATFDHQFGRTVGKRDDRIVVDGEWWNAALSLESNTLKGSKRYSWQNGEYKPRPVAGEA
jgi:hypothetical protein